MNLSESEECFSTIQCFISSPLGITDIAFGALAVIFNSLYLYVRIHKKRDVESNIPTVMLSCVNIIIALEMTALFMFVGSFPIETLRYNYVTAGNAFGFFWQVLLLFCVSIDRYIAIIKPLRYHQIITKKRVIIATVGAGIIALLLSTILLTIPSLTVAEAYELALQNNVSDLTMRYMYTKEFIIVWQILYGPFAVISAIMCGIYVVIIIAIRKQLKNSLTTLKDYRGTLLLFVSMVYFLVTYLPLFMINCFPRFLDMPMTDPTFTSLATMLSVCTISSGFVNSLLYGVGSKAFWVTLCSHCKTKNEIDVEG